MSACVLSEAVVSFSMCISFSFSVCMESCLLSLDMSRDVFWVKKKKQRDCGMELLSLDISGDVFWVQKKQKQRGCGMKLLSLESRYV